MMSSESELDSIDRARQEVAAALAILLDPATSPTSAEIHLLHAWRLLHSSETGATWAEDDTALVSWIDGSAQALSERERKRAALLVDQLARDLGRPPPERASNRSRRQLLESARELRRAIDGHERRLRGAPAMRRAWLLRGAGFAAALGLFAAFVITIRGEPDGGSGPWRATLYPTPSFEGAPTLQRYADIGFEWGTGSPHERIPGSAFSGTWDTCFVVPEKMAPLFLLQSDDGSRLFVDGKLAVNAWSGGARRQAQGAVELMPGVHHLRLDYFELGGVASLHLRVSLSGEKPAPIPASVLRYPADTSGSGDPCGAVQH